MTNLRSWVSYFFLGMFTDLLVVLYYRAIQAQHVGIAVILSVAITTVPFFVMERSFSKKARLWIWYALGCGLGTALGMVV
jgi:hypothetical protein